MNCKSACVARPVGEICTFSEIVFGSRDAIPFHAPKNQKGAFTMQMRITRPCD